MVPLLLPLLLFGGATAFAAGKGIKRVSKALEGKIKAAHVEIKDASVTAGEDDEREPEPWEERLRYGNFEPFEQHIPQSYTFGNPLLRLRLIPSDDVDGYKARVQVFGACGMASFDGHCAFPPDGIAGEEDLTAEEQELEAEQNVLEQEADAYEDELDGGGSAPYDSGSPSDDGGGGGDDQGGGGGGGGGEAPYDKKLAHQQERHDFRLAKQAERLAKRDAIQQRKNARLQSRLAKKAARQQRKTARQQARQNRRARHHHRRVAGIAVGRAIGRAYQAIVSGAPDLHVGALPMLGALALARRLFLLAKAGDTDSQAEFDKMKSTGNQAEKKAARAIEQLLGGGR